MGAQEQRDPRDFVRQAGATDRYRPDELAPPLFAVVHSVGRGVDRPGCYRVQKYPVLPYEFCGERLDRYPIEILGQDVSVTRIIAVDGRARTDQDDLSVALFLHVIPGGPDEMIRPHEVDPYCAQQSIIRQVQRVLLPELER